MRENLYLGGTFRFKCYDEKGVLKWDDEAKNLVVDEGLQHILDELFDSGAQVDPWYVGLMDSSPSVSSTDTGTGHDGWTEFTEYSSDRKEYDDSRTDESVSNSTSAATFSITSTGGGVGGAFLIANTSSSTGVLLSAGALSGGDRSPSSGDTVEVTYTFNSSGG